MTRLADTNIWLALTLSMHTHHGAARTWLKRTKQGDKLAFCRATQLSYLRLLTTPEVLTRYDVRALTNSEAWEAYANWLGDDRVTFVEEQPALESSWKRFATRNTASPKIWMDAYLAAFALSSDFQLVTTDRSFRQYKGLNVEVLKA